MNIWWVSMSLRHFPDGRITAEAMKAAELDGALEMRPVKHAFRHAPWCQVIGTSGTIRAIRDVVQSAGWTGPEEGITKGSLKMLRKALIKAGSIDRLQLGGLSDERRPVFPGGVAVLRSVFKALKIERMQISDLALREGVIYEMLGRMHHGDVRDGSVNALCRRHNVDIKHARRVEATVRMLFAQAALPWNLLEGEYGQLLEWATRLHETGLTVSHSQYHKHGAYLIANADLPGFTRQEQCLLAALVRGHRRKFPLDAFNSLPAGSVVTAMRLCLLLRLAVLLHRSRSATLRTQVSLQVDGQGLTLHFPAGWLKSHSLQRKELEQEAKLLETAGFRLKFG